MENLCGARKYIPVLVGKPQAKAYINGKGAYSAIKGEVCFFNTCHGVLVTAEMNGLPKDRAILAVHIHGGKSCGGNAEDPFAMSMSHFNPLNKPHPYHAGDMPPLFNNSGYAFMSFVTDRFNVSEIIGRTVIIHDKADDFTTQPAGNSGKKIACGVIR